MSSMKNIKKTRNLTQVPSINREITLNHQGPLSWKK